MRRHRKDVGVRISQPSQPSINSICRLGGGISGGLKVPWERILRIPSASARSLRGQGAWRVDRSILCPRRYENTMGRVTAVYSNAFLNSGIFLRNLMLLLRSRVKSGIWSLLASPRTILRANAFSLASCPCRKQCCFLVFLIRASGPWQPQRQAGWANHAKASFLLARCLSQALCTASDRSDFRASGFSVAILPLETPRIRRHNPIACMEVLLLLSIRSASELPGTVHKPNGAPLATSCSALFALCWQMSRNCYDWQDVTRRL